MILNLDPHFAPCGDGVPVNSFSFPSGCEPHVKIRATANEVDPHAVLTTRVASSDDVMRVFLATDALRRMGVKTVELVLPYVPFARQDRPMVSGEPLSVKVFATLLNAQRFERVTVYDPHSDVSTALIDNCYVVNNHDFVRWVVAQRYPDDESFFLASPDAGAYKKVYGVHEAIGGTGTLLMCNKHRDVATGKLSGVSVDATDLYQRDVLIVDDICDGGGTFILLAKELKKRNAGRVVLVVSHGIFSQGFESLREHIDAVYTTDSVKDVNDPFVIQYKLHFT